MITRIHLIRHAETRWNAEGRFQGRLDSSLSETGRRSAHKLRENLPVQGIDQFFSSSSLRARETTDILLRKETNAVTYLDTLQEIRLGPWEGMLISDIEREYPVEYRNYLWSPGAFRLTGAETLSALQRRGVKAIRHIAAQCPEATALVVSHGTLIKSILTYYEGRDLDGLAEAPEIGNCSHSIIEFNASLSSANVQYATDFGF